MSFVLKTSLVWFFFNRSWMYVDDCAEAILKVTENGRLGETYNIGTDFEKRNYDLTLQIHDTVAKLLDR